MATHDFKIGDIVIVTNTNLNYHGRIGIIEYIYEVAPTVTHDVLKVRINDMALSVSSASVEHYNASELEIVLNNLDTKPAKNKVCYFP